MKTGQWQAQRVADALADEGIEAIYTSDLLRAHQTGRGARRTTRPDDHRRPPLARALFRGVRDPDVRPPSTNAGPRPPAAGVSARPAFAPDGGESLDAFSQRCVGAVIDLRTGASGADHRHRCAWGRDGLSLPGGHAQSIFRHPAPGISEMRASTGCCSAARVWAWWAGVTRGTSRATCSTSSPTASPRGAVLRSAATRRTGRETAPCLGGVTPQVTVGRQRGDCGPAACAADSPAGSGTAR